MLNIFPRTSSIRSQIRIITALVALSGLLIVAAVLDQSQRLQTLFDDHAKLVETDKKITEFNKIVTGIRELSMTLAGTGNSGASAYEDQIELFAKVNEAGAIGAKISNINAAYAAIIDPYSFESELGVIANQITALEPMENAARQKAVILKIEESTGNVMNRVTKLSEAAKDESIASQKKMEGAFSRGFLAILVVCGLNVIACLSLARHLVKRVAEPAQNIARTTEELANGDLNVTVPSSNLSELQAIAIALEKFRESAHREKRIALEDLISGLPNRRAFINKLQSEIEMQKEQFLLAYLDVDRFKDINDGYGHDIGDALVKAIGDRLRSMVPEHIIIARIGGDEFAILVDGKYFSDPGALGKILTKAMSEPFACKGFTVATTASIGITTRAHKQSVELLMQEADVALYQAKANGRDQYMIYSADMAAEKNLLRILERDLPQAIHSGQLRMEYQPILSTRNPNQHELEALVRWNHPSLGQIQPDIFIGIAEKSGLMNTLGKWIINSVFAEMRAWPHVKTSINLSVIQLKSVDFIEDVLAAARKYAVVPQQIEFEITESLEIENSERALLTLGLLRSHGFRIALDDFGTGYSSLSFIKNYPLDRIKLDRSLLDNIGEGGIADAVIEAAVALGSRLDLEIVAEGVEEHRQVVQMYHAGCSHLQGYYFSRPLSKTQVLEYFEQTALANHSEEPASYPQKKMAIRN